MTTEAFIGIINVARVGISVAHDNPQAARQVNTGGLPMTRPASPLWYLASQAFHDLDRARGDWGLGLPVLVALGSPGPRGQFATGARQVRDFAKAVGKLAKTDAIDAQVGAHFADGCVPSSGLCRMLAHRH